MTHLMIAGGMYLLLLALIIAFNRGRTCIDFRTSFQGHPTSGWLFYLPLTWGGKERM